MFIAMNKFKVNAGREADFEQIWADRDTYLDQVPGFIHFTLLRGDAEGEYISHSTWENRDAFMAWTQSEAFRKGHAQGSMAGILSGAPVVSLYESALVQEAGGPIQRL